MRSHSLLIRLGLAGAMAAISFASHAQTTDYTKPIATVNGESIVGTEFVHRMEFLPGVGRMEGAKFIETYPSYLALQQLINERLMLQLAKERGCYPKPEEVKAEVDKRVKATPDVIANLAKVGVSQADFERGALLDLAEYKIITQGINVTNQEVEKHYADNPALYTVPKRYQLRVIASDEKGKAAIDAELAKGTNFAEIAKKMSTAGSAPQGGLMEPIAIDQFQPGVKSALEVTRIGKYTDWVQGESAWFRFYVENVLPEEKQKLDADLRESIRKRLMYDRGSVKNNLDMLMTQMRNKAKVSVTQPWLDGQIQQWLQRPY